MQQAAAPAAAAPAAAPAPPAPEPIEVSSLLQSMGVDARVEFAASEAPVDRGLAEAAIHLADAIAKGDDRRLASLLDKGDQQILERLKSTDQWIEATDGIEAVRVVSIDSVAKGSEEPESAQVALAVQDRDGAYILAWSGKKVFDEWLFNATPSSDEERARASEWDGMAPVAAGGADAMAALLAGHQELRDLLTKGMTSPDDLSLEDLQRLKELLAELDVAPPGAIEMIEQEIAKRQKRETGGDDEGGGDEGGGGRPGGG